MLISTWRMHWVWMGVCVCLCAVCFCTIMQNVPFQGQGPHCILCHQQSTLCCFMLRLNQKLWIGIVSNMEHLSAIILQASRQECNPRDRAQARTRSSLKVVTYWLKSSPLKVGGRPLFEGSIKGRPKQGSRLCSERSHIVQSWERGWKNRPGKVTDFRYPLDWHLEPNWEAFSTALLW